MTHTIKKLSRYRPLIDQIDDYVARHLSWDMLSYSQIEMLAGHGMKALGSDADVCLTESDDMSLILHLISKKLLTGKNADELADVVASTCVTYLHDSLETVYRERAADMEYEVNTAAGLKQWTNKQTGEVEWIRAQRTV